MTSNHLQLTPRTPASLQTRLQPTPHPHPQFFGPFYRGSDFTVTKQLTVTLCDLLTAHLLPMHPRSRSRTAAAPTHRQKRLGATPPCCRKSIFFSHDFDFMNFGYFTLTGQQTIERAIESRTRTRPEPLALFSRYKQLAFSCRTTRKDSRKPVAITTRLPKSGWKIAFHPGTKRFLLVPI